jgi:hypothetical protein
VQVSHGRAAHKEVCQNPYLLYLLERCRIAPHHTRRFESRQSHINRGQQQKLALTLSHSRSSSNCTVRCSRAAADCPHLSITICLSAPLNIIYPSRISLRATGLRRPPPLNTGSLRARQWRRGIKRRISRCLCYSKPCGVCKMESKTKEQIMQGREV